MLIQWMPKSYGNIFPKQKGKWYYNIPSAEVIKKIPVEFLMKAYYGLHDLELDLAVKKVGEV